METTTINGQGPFRPLYIKPKASAGLVSYRSKYDYLHPEWSRLYVDFDEMTVEIYPRYGRATKENLYLEVA